MWASARETGESIRIGPCELVWDGISESMISALAQVRAGTMGTAEISLYQPGRGAVSSRRVQLTLHELPPARWTRGPVAFTYGDDGSYGLESDVLCARLTGLDAEDSTAPIHGIVSVAPDEQTDEIQGWKIALRSASNALVSTIAPALGALMVHGCAMVAPDSERALVFVGPSGAGKSTMVRRLDGWRPLGDDSVVVWFEGERPVVAGTPFISKNWLPCWGEPHELAGIVALQPGAAELSLEPLTEAAAYATGIRSTFLTCGSGPVIASALEIIERVLSSVPAYTLHSNLEHELGPLLEPLL